MNEPHLKVSRAMTFKEVISLVFGIGMALWVVWLARELDVRTFYDPHVEATIRRMVKPEALNENQKITEASK